MHQPTSSSPAVQGLYYFLGGGGTAFIIDLYNFLSTAAPIVTMVLCFVILAKVKEKHREPLSTDLSTGDGTVTLPLEHDRTDAGGPPNTSKFCLLYPLPFLCNF